MATVPGNRKFKLVDLIDAQARSSAPAEREENPVQFLLLLRIKPALRDKSMRIRKVLLIMKGQTIGHSDRSTPRDDPVTILDFTIRCYASQSRDGTVGKANGLGENRSEIRQLLQLL